MRRPLIALAAAALPAICALALSFAGTSAQPSPSQEEGEEDKYVRLMSAQSVSMVEIDGKSYRKAEGPARFLHNDTWLICDTALWEVDGKIIHARGHVSIEQDETELTSDSLTYFIEKDLAEFRGAIVELLDKDGNMLRTRNLDYNTKDSVAVFRYGGAMRDSKGKIMESRNGTYEAKLKLFTFKEAVNMFTDSVFIKTSLLYYDTDKALATFPEPLEAWTEDKMLSSDRGSYRRNDEYFFFNENVHAMSKDKECWCDSLYFDKIRTDVKMRGHLQLTDESRGVSSLSDYADYFDTTSTIILTRDPVVIMATQERKNGKNVPDTVYVRADTIRYWAVPKCEIDSLVAVQAAERLKQLDVDPVANIRAKAAEELAKQIEAAKENDPNRPPDLSAGDADMKGPGPGKGQKPSGKPSGGASGSTPPGGPGKAPENGGPGPGSEGGPDAPADSLSSPADSLALSDSLAVSDSLLKAEDTVKLGFLSASHRVKMFRGDMQLVCDSLEFCELDSLARLFKDPVIWNERNRQYTADSIYVVIGDGQMRKADLLSNAFIHIKEDDVHFDQIRATEMMAYFDDSTRLSRFDAMGSTVGLFYLKEEDKERIATANRKECSIMSAVFKDGDIHKISYFETPKSNAYPVAQMRRDELQLKGFCWHEDIRPMSPKDITTRHLRKSERARYVSRPRPEYRQTNIYFPGYMDKIYREIERSDSLRRLNASRGPAAALPPHLLDSLSSAQDSLSALSDSLNTADTLSPLLAPPADTVASADALSSGEAPESSDAAAIAATATAAGGISAAASQTDVSTTPSDSTAAAQEVQTASLDNAPDTSAFPGFIYVHPDDSLHRGGDKRGGGHFIIRDTLDRYVSLDSFALKLYVDTLVIKRMAAGEKLSIKKDTAALSDSLNVDDRSPVILSDSLGNTSTPLSREWSVEMVPYTKRELQRIASDERLAEWIRKIEAKQAVREEQWKELDKKDADKRAAKEAKKQAREQARMEAYLRKMAERKAVEDALYERYKQRYFEKMRKKEGLL